MIIEISLSFYTLDLVIVAFLLSRDFPLLRGLALTSPAILAADVPLSPGMTIGADQGGPILHLLKGAVGVKTREFSGRSGCSSV